MSKYHGEGWWEIHGDDSVAEGGERKTSSCVLAGDGHQRRFCRRMRTPRITTGLLLGMLASFAGTLARGLELKCGADHNCNMLPDMSEPTNSRHLKCGACQLAAVQLAHAVIKKEAALKQKMTEFDATTLLEGFCEKDIAEYGLQLDSNGAPMARFTNDPKLNRAQGGWVKRTLMGVCGDMISDYEHLFLAASSSYCTTEQADDDASAVLTCDPAPLSERLCVRELKLCRPEDIPSRAAASRDPTGIDFDEDEGDTVEDIEQGTTSTVAGDTTARESAAEAGSDKDKRKARRGTHSQRQGVGSTADRAQEKRPRPDQKSVDANSGAGAAAARHAGGMLIEEEYGGDDDDFADLSDLEYTGGKHRWGGAVGAGDAEQVPPTLVLPGFKAHDSANPESEVEDGVGRQGKVVAPDVCGAEWAQYGRLMDVDDLVRLQSSITRIRLPRDPLAERTHPPTRSRRALMYTHPR